MLECLILGDEIAQGVAQYKPQCAIVAKAQINSEDWKNVNSCLIQPAGYTIISLGTNDPATVITEWQLQEIRNRIKTGRVFWIMPVAKHDVINLQNVVDLVAKLNGDTIIRTNQISADKKYPSLQGYKSLAEQIK